MHTDIPLIVSAPYRLGGKLAGYSNSEAPAQGMLCPSDPQVCRMMCACQATGWVSSAKPALSHQVRHVQGSKEDRHQSVMSEAHYVSCLAGPNMHVADNNDDDDQVRTADLRLMAHSLVGFAAQQNLRLDTFAMGPASRALGTDAPAVSLSIRASVQPLMLLLSHVLCIQGG